MPVNKSDTEKKWRKHTRSTMKLVENNEFIFLFLFL